MKSNSALPGGSLTSKPTWLNTAGYSVTSAFFVSGDVKRAARECFLATATIAIRQHSVVVFSYDPLVNQRGTEPCP